MLLAHGAGSSPDVVARLLAPCLPDLPVLAPVLRGSAADSAEELDDLAREHEVVLADHPLDALELVEEELLLTLPYAPRCADPACAMAARSREAPIAAASPFAALAGFGKPAGRKRRN